MHKANSHSDIGPNPPLPPQYYGRWTVNTRRLNGLVVGGVLGALLTYLTVNKDASNSTVMGAGVGALIGYAVFGIGFWDTPDLPWLPVYFSATPKSASAKMKAVSAKTNLSTTPSISS